MRFEAGNLRVTYLDMVQGKKYNRKNKDIKGNLKIIHLSDIHIENLYVKTQKIKKVISVEKPDLIFITGDFLDKYESIEKLLNFFHSIGPFEVPVYAVRGNHDIVAFEKHENLGTALGETLSIHENNGTTFRELPLTHENNRTTFRETHSIHNNNETTFREILSYHGIKLLVNETVNYTKDKTLFHIYGIDDIRKGVPDISRFSLNNNFSNPGDNQVILLSHNPDIITELPDTFKGWVFCGHFHGGQIYTPFKLEFRLLRKDKLYKYGMIKGHHIYKGISLYINRGLGCVVFPFRFLSPPEIAVISIRHHILQ